MGRIQSQGIMEVEEAAAVLDKRDHGLLLLVCHPDEVVACVSIRALKSITEDHQQLDPCQVLGGEGANIHREMGNHTGCLESGAQTLLDVTRLVWLIADEHQGMGNGVEP